MKAEDYKNLNSDELEMLHNIVFAREYNPAHEDDYFNAGGFFAHWSMYSDEERAFLYDMAQAKPGNRTLNVNDIAKSLVENNSWSPKDFEEANVYNWTNSFIEAIAVFEDEVHSKCEEILEGK